MSHFLKNSIAVLRGNVVLGWNRILGRCKYRNVVRIFKSADVEIAKGGKLVLGKGVAIGARSQCLVVKGATLKMGDMSSLNSDCKIVCQESIEIGNNTIFGPNVLVYDHDHVFDTENGVRRKEYKSSSIVIGNNCWIGANTVILRGTRIGDNCLVGAGCVLKGNYPSGSKIVQKRTDCVIL